MKQVDKTAYNFHSYCGKDRWVSYYHQIDEILKLNPKNMLEIGSGGHFVKNYIKNNTNIDYKNLDIADDLNPDIMGSVDDIPLPDDSFDLVCAFQILEHLPFEKFEKSLLEIKRISRGSVLISLPHFGTMIKFSFKIPFIKEKRFAFKIPYSIKHKFDGQHYWEIGKKGYSRFKIKSIIERHFIIKDDFIPFDNSYHHFYILKNR